MGWINPLGLGPLGPLTIVSPLYPFLSVPPVSWLGIGQSVERLFQISLGKLEGTDYSVVILSYHYNILTS